MTENLFRLKHRVCINIRDEHGHPQPVLRSGTVRIPKRLLKLLFGDFCEVFVLTPGKTVDEIDVQEVHEEKSFEPIDASK